MSNEVKRWWIKNEDGLVDVFNVRKHVLDYKPEGFDEKTPLGPRYIEVMRVEDHERIVAGLKAQLEHSETKVSWLLRDNERVLKEKDAAYNELDDINMALNEKIDKQKRVIVILTQQRNVAHERARVSADEMMQFMQEDDAEIAAIEKGEA